MLPSSSSSSTFRRSSCHPFLALLALCGVLVSHAFLSPAQPMRPPSSSSLVGGRLHAVSMVAPSLPLDTKQGLKVDYSKIVSQAAAATSAALSDTRKRLLTIDFPPLEGTTAVKRYEADRDFALKYLKALGFTNIFPVGEEIYIKKTLKAGEYLSQEGLAAYRARQLNTGKTPCTTMTVILNPSLDLTYLKDLRKEYDADGSSPVVLVNCGLEKLTFLDKLTMGGGKYIESYEPVYTLKKVGSSGFLFKPSLQDPWQTHAVLNAPKPFVQLIDEVGARPKFLDVENKIKAAVAANLEQYQRKAQEAKKMNKLASTSFPRFE